MNTIRKILMNLFIGYVFVWMFFFLFSFGAILILPIVQYNDGLVLSSIVLSILIYPVALLYLIISIKEVFE